MPPLTESIDHPCLPWYQFNFPTSVSTNFTNHPNPRPSTTISIERQNREPSNRTNRSPTPKQRRCLHTYPPLHTACIETSRSTNVRSLLATDHELVSRTEDYAEVASTLTYRYIHQALAGQLKTVITVIARFGNPAWPAFRRGGCIVAKSYGAARTAQPYLPTRATRILDLVSNSSCPVQPHPLLLTISMSEYTKY